MIQYPYNMGSQRYEKIFVIQALYYYLKNILRVYYGVIFVGYYGLVLLRVSQNL